VEAHEPARISLSSYELLFVVSFLFIESENQPVPFSSPLSKVGVL
jgi:hypothetical protein